MRGRCNEGGLLYWVMIAGPCIAHAEAKTAHAEAKTGRQDDIHVKTIPMSQVLCAVLCAVL